MKRVIDGRIYNTETATRICRLDSRSDNWGDFRWHETELYKSPRGAFFLAGEGGAMSMWATGDGYGSSIGGSGLRVVDKGEARYYAEAADLDPDVYEQVFGAVAIG